MVVCLEFVTGSSGIPQGTWGLTQLAPSLDLCLYMQPGAQPEIAETKLNRDPHDSQIVQ